MPNKTYASGTLIDSASLNDFNDATYEILGDGTNPAATKAQARANLGLGNVDNTTDANKPVSTAQAAAIAAAVAPKANLASPALTGNPTAPTPAVGDNDTSIATTAFVYNNSLRGNMFKATHQVSQPLAGGADTVVSFSNKDFDMEGGVTVNAFNTATGRFTPTVAGYYFVRGLISPIIPGGWFTTVIGSIRKNGTVISRLGILTTTSASAISFYSVAGSDIIFCNGTTDYIDLTINVTGGGGTASLAANYADHLFSAHYLHP